MNRHLHRVAFAAGLLAVGWVAAGYLPTHPLALGMTLLIATAYVAGALELRRFGRDTSDLARAVGSIPEPLATLDDWLGAVPASLRHAVQRRIEGDRVALPGPALAPTLAGLAVLLGMLGTFLGMVVTLNGTSLALERATDLQTMRDSLAAPVKGLGLAFGTSVAGVAASAMLGLMSALRRRDRQQVTQRLDTAIATSLRAFTRAHQRAAALELQQQQARLVPALVDQVQGLVAALQAQARQSNEALLERQERFHERTEAVYRTLAGAVEQTLRQSLTHSAEAAAATIDKAAQATMGGIARETTALHERIAGVATAQLDGVSARLDSAVASIAANWQAALAHQQAQSAARDEQRLGAWTAALAATAATLQREWQEAGAQAQAQQAQICDALERTAGRISAQAEAHARSTLAEVERLVQAASEAPRAAAEVIAQLRETLTDSLQRDNAMLDERQRLLAALNQLLAAVQQTSAAQGAAIDALVASASTRLEQAGSHFAAHVDTGSARLETLAAQLTGSAVDVASLGEAFGAAIGVFSQTGEQLMAHLQRLDATLGRSIARSDEQLAYYVAQAREVIDLSLLSHKQIVDDLQRLADSRVRQGSQAVEA